ncbi:MAG: AAA family ATPase, partial [Candidatus Zixiibacteriota bacterium]
PEQAFVPIDTNNILFICGGAFDGLEKIVARRIGKRTVGFETEKIHIDTKTADIFDHVTPSDLIEYGLIPEMVGRLPVTASLQALDEEALLNILTEPKNALTKQYSRLLELDGVSIRFEPEALRAAAKLAMQKKTGARALRSIFEKAMLETMYQIPSMSDITEVVISAKVFTEGAKPKIITRTEKKKAG